MRGHNIADEINMSIQSYGSQSEEARIQGVYAGRHDDQRNSWFRAGHLFMIQSRERRLLGILEKYRLSSLGHVSILEVGCGTGYWLRQFINWGMQPENIHGVDLVEERISEARRLCPNTVHLTCGSAAKLDYTDNQFDLVLQSTVLTSVLDQDMQAQIASEMLRVVKIGGAIIWYDFHVNNPRNSNVRGVNKKEIRKLFPNCELQLHRVTLAPPIARMLAPVSWVACSLLEYTKIFNTHYLGIIQRS